MLTRFSGLVRSSYFGDDNKKRKFAKNPSLEKNPLLQYFNNATVGDSGNLIFEMLVSIRNQPQCKKRGKCICFPLSEKSLVNLVTLSFHFKIHKKSKLPLIFFAS